MKPLKNVALAVSLLLAGCGAHDQAAEHAGPGSTEEAVKAVTVAAGTYENGAGTWVGDDFGFLQLLADGRWLGTICVDAPCNEYVAQDGHFVVTPSNGKTYLYFYAGGSNCAMCPPTDPKTLQAVYQVKSSSTGKLSLRKAHTSRWFSLAKVTEHALCDASSGTFDATKPAGQQCDCSALGKAVFLAGEGGCTALPEPSEALCDGTKGSWTDDDSNLQLTYCDCGVDRAWTDGVGCTDY